jgi:hypothetical protein
MLFDVRVLAFDPSAPDPVLALVRVFKVDRSLAVELVSGLPRVVKRGVPLETAQRFSHVLASLGAQTEVVTAGGRARAVGAADTSAMEGTPSSAYSTQRYTLPQPNRVAIDTALARGPENANGTRQSGVLGAIQLTQVRASSPSYQPVTEVHPDARSSGVQGRVLRETLPDPDQQADMMFRETLEARLRTAQPPSARPGSYVHSSRPASSSQRPIASSPGAYSSHSACPPVLPGQSHGATLRHSLPGVDPARRARARAALAGLTTAVVRGAALAERKAQLRASGPLVITAWLLSAVMLACLSLITLGMLPVVLLGYLAFDLCRRWSLRRSIESSAVLATSAQFPELYACVRDMGERLALPGAPRLYISGGVPAGVSSVVFGGEVTLLLSAETLADHIDNDQCHALAFVIAHELSSVALGQHGRLRSFLAWLWPQVRKLDVLGADTLAVELMADRHLAHAALLTLLMGPRVAMLLDAADLDRQAAMHATESRFYAPALAGQSEFLLARLYRLRRA